MPRYSHLGIYLIVVLVLSITPATAVQINTSMSNDLNENKNQLGNDHGELTNDLSQLKTTINKIDDYQNAINSAKHDLNRCHWWSWCYYAARYACIWVVNIAKIVIASSSLSSQTDQLSSASKSMNETSSDLKGLKVSDINQTTAAENSTAMDDATAMADQFKSLNISVNIVAANNFTNGTNADIIQYKTKGGQYRYLKYVTQHRDIIQFEGAYNKYLVLNQSDVTANTQLKLTVNNTTKSSRLVDIAYQIEKAEIQDKKDKINQDIKDKQGDLKYWQNLQNTGTWISSIGFAIEVISSIIIAVSSAAAAAVLPTPAAPAAIPLTLGVKIGIGILVVSGLLIGIGQGMSLAGMVNVGICNDEMDALNNTMNKLNGDLVDLNSYCPETFVAPVAGNMNFTTHEGRDINASLNGTDSYDDPITYHVLLPAGHGNLTVDGNGSFVYKAYPGFTGNDYFTYEVHDDELNLTSDVGTVTVEVQPDQPPVVENQNFYMASNSEYNGTLNGTDPEGDNITCESVTQPTHGNLTLTDDGKFVYIPNGDYVGNDSFTFKTNDGVLDSQIGNVTIHIVTATTPLANNMVLNIPHDTMLNKGFNVSGIVDNKIFTIDSLPEHGNITLSDENFTYQPVNGYNGDDMFTYHFTDVLGHVSNTAEVKISVISSPTVKNMTFNSLINTKLRASFNVTGYNVNVNLLNLPKHGNLTLTNGSFTYKPNKDYVGIDTFTYQLIDALGQKSNPATITINVTKKLANTEVKDLPTKKVNINQQNKQYSQPNLDLDGDRSDTPNTSNISVNETPSQLTNDINPLEQLMNMKNTVTQWINNVQNTVTGWINNSKTTINNLFNTKLF